MLFIWKGTGDMINQKSPASICCTILIFLSLLAFSDPWVHRKLRLLDMNLAPGPEVTLLVIAWINWKRHTQTIIQLGFPGYIALIKAKLFRHFMAQFDVRNSWHLYNAILAVAKTKEAFDWPSSFDRNPDAILMLWWRQICVLSLTKYSNSNMALE